LTTENRCMGLNNNLRRCGRHGEWRLFCADHRRQWIIWMFGLVFTVAGGTASIISQTPLLNFLMSDKVIVEGRSNIEKTINKAMMEGVYHTTPNSSVLLGKVYVRPVLEFMDTPENDSHIAVTLISNFKPSDSSYVYEADDCRFLGKASHFDKDNMIAHFYIYAASCTRQYGTNYISNVREMENVSAIGYLSLPGLSGKKNIPVISENKSYTLPYDYNVEIHLNPEYSMLKPND
jgi:hypothetical protein